MKVPIILRRVSTERMAIIAPHLRAIEEAERAIRAFAQMDAPDLMSRPEVSFDARLGAYISTAELSEPETAPPQNGKKTSRVNASVD